MSANRGLDRLVIEEQYPASGSDDEKLAFLSRYGVLAPSVRNSQPWLFDVKDGRVHLSADRSRALPQTDPDQRELVISCGAALYHFCAAARHFGHSVHVETFPEGMGDLLATVRLGEPQAPKEIDTILFYAIHKSSSAVMPFKKRRQVPQDLLDELMSMGNSGETWLHLVQEKTARGTVAGLVAEGDAAQMKNEEFRRELADWISPSNRRNHHYGRGFVQGVSYVATYIESFLIRNFERAEAFAEHDRKFAESAPVLAVLGTYDNTPLSWLAAGQKLAEILLRAVAIGVHASFLNQPVQVPELRDKLTEVLGQRGYPQLMFCLGFTEAPGSHRPASEMVRQGFV